MYGSEIDSLLIDISSNSGASYTNVFAKFGDQGNQWVHELVDLVATAVMFSSKLLEEEDQAGQEILRLIIFMLERRALHNM